MSTLSYWHRQDPNEPLYPDVVWNKPENRLQAGKLLIVGGNSFGFAAPATAYSEALQAGVGVARALLPESLHKTVGSFLPDAEFAPNNASGSFAASTLEPLLTHAAWADATLLAGDFGRNSETAVMLEKFVQSSYALLSVTQDAAEYFLKSPLLLLNRPNTALFLSFEQLQKYGLNAHCLVALQFSMDITRTVQWLHEFTLNFGVTIVTMHHQHYIVAYGGQVITQHSIDDEKIWRVKKAARASVFWLQLNAKPLQAIATSLVSHEKN